MSNKVIISLTILILAGIILFPSCQSETIATDANIPLRFSRDTVRFDTVFTTAGSATRSFKIFNDLDEGVIINSISLQSPNSFFRLNADGINGNTVEGIRIEPNDSIYVFTEVTIDPDNPLSISPFFIEEKVNIQVNDSSYDVVLEAWGQNANYIPNRQSAGRVTYVSCDFGDWTWDDPKPYVIYGVLLIDSCSLVLPPGTEVYVHGGVAINELGIFNDGLLIFGENGNLKSRGTLENPNLFKTDRLEQPFDDVQGQWSGILLSRGSKNNEILHTKIENSIVGVSVDSAASLRIISSQIGFTSGSGITASHASIYGENCLVYENGGSSLSLNFGGSYTFNYCTFANYLNQNPALNANNIKCLDPDCTQILTNGLVMRFNNCILVGNDSDEIGMLDFYEGQMPNEFEYEFDHSIVTVDELLDADQFPEFFNNCEDCLQATRNDTLFMNIDEFDFRLDTMSIAIDKAKNIPLIPVDILGFERDPNAPDVGCYEFQK